MLVPLAAIAVALASPAHPCRAALPHGPAVPAPIVLWTGCGAFRLGTNGGVRRLPRHWLALHGWGTGRRFGTDLQIRRDRPGRIVLLRNGRALWRSRALYPNDGADVAFGPGLFAFAAYRRGVFVTDLQSPERLVVPGRGVYPYAFTRQGRLLVTGGRTLAVVSRDGTTLRRFRLRSRDGLAFDERTDTLYFATPGRMLVAMRGTRATRVRQLGSTDGWIGFARPGLLVFQRPHAIDVLDLRGAILARARWSPKLGTVDTGVSVSADGRAFAFRVAGPGTARIFVLHRGGGRAQLVYRHALGPSGCGAGANLGWHGRSILYVSSDGRLGVIAPGSGRVVDLSRLGRALPGSPGERASASWASAFRAVAA